MADVWPWVLIALAGFAGSALCSGMETGSYAVNRVRLQIAAHRNRRHARTLDHELDRPDRLLSTLLIGNNLANYMGTAGLAVVLGVFALNEWELIVINTLIVTPLLFVFGETLPKDLFLAHADRLMRRMTPALVWMRWFFLPALWLVQGFTELVTRVMPGVPKIETLHPRRRVEALVREGVGYGVVTASQSQMVERVLELGRRTVAEQMTPWEAVKTISPDANAESIQAIARRARVQRLPVVEAGRVVGMVDVLSVLRGETEDGPVASWMSPALALPGDTLLRRGLDRMRREGVALAVVLDEQDQPTGVVSVRDLVEPITGRLAGW